jgi:hypothetical protein
MHELADEKARAERARLRFESRNERIDAEQKRRNAELAAQKETALKAGPKAIQDILKRVGRKHRPDDGEDQ